RQPRPRPPTASVTSYRSVEHPDGPDLEPAVWCRHLLRDLDGLVKVLGLDEVVAAEGFFGLGERAVGHDAVANGRRGRCLLQRVATAQRRAVVLGELGVALHQAVPQLLATICVLLLVAIDEDQVLRHRCPSTRARLSGRTTFRRTASGHIDTAST